MSGVKGMVVKELKGINGLEMNFGMQEGKLGVRCVLEDVKVSGHY